MRPIYLLLSLLLITLLMTGCSSTEQPVPSAPTTISATATPVPSTATSVSATATPVPSTAKPTPRGPTRLGISFDAEISSAEVQSWVELAVGEMQDPPTDFLGLIWPIGLPVDDEPDPQLFDGARFSEHEHTLSPAKVNEAVATFVNWQTSLEGCSDAERREFSDGARVIDLYIRGGADVATAPGPCLKSRSSIYARTPTQDKTTATEIFFHETYHGLSNYLLNGCATNAPGRSEDDLGNRRWFAEGTADYFGVYMAAKVEGQDDHRQKVLKRAYQDLQGDPGMGLENAYVQSAAIVLMIDLGVLSEEKILNGSWYHDCSWVDVFDPQAVGIDYIFENFNKIQLLGGEYSYPSEVISG